MEGGFRSMTPQNVKINDLGLETNEGIRDFSPDETEK
jgi:hypothetical protein